VHHPSADSELVTRPEVKGGTGKWDDKVAFYAARQV